MTIQQFDNFNKKADKVPAATENNIATFDASGNPKDGGGSIADVKSRVNHTGSQAISTITDLQTNLDAKVNTSDIKNNLTSTDTNKPLSALQGKELEDNKLDKTGDGSQLTNVSASQPTGSYIVSIATNLTGAIACDGSSYVKTDYSSLYALITAELGANALEDPGNSSNFILPNLEGRVIGVAGGGRNLFDLVGSDTHTLSTNEIPSHSHGYSKGYFPGSASGSATNAGAGYFWSYTTGTTSNAGGGQAHSIVQKTGYIAKKVFIYY